MENYCYKVATLGKTLKQGTEVMLVTTFQNGKLLVSDKKSNMMYCASTDIESLIIETEVEESLF